MTREATGVLVEKYRLLRQDDASTNKNSYRITVRQLESMIRLSEAIARANCTNEITPAFVREAYSLLRQSIIHVEQDDIDFDEEELEGERDRDRSRKPNGHATAEDGEDAEMMTQEQLTALDEMETTFNNTHTSTSHPLTSPTRAGGTGAQLMPTSPSTPQPAPPPKRKMKISHDEYVSIQTLIILHLSAHERETGRGIDRDELVDWYLEQKEEEMGSVEELEYQSELVRKVLRKLVKVRKKFLSVLCQLKVEIFLVFRTTSSLKLKATSTTHNPPQWTRAFPRKTAEKQRCIIWYIPRWIPTSRVLIRGSVTF